MKYSLEKLEKQANQLKILNEEKMLIQSKFDFKIPNYILDEIVKSKEKINKDNIIALINLAKVNEKLTSKQANLLKKEYYK